MSLSAAGREDRVGGAASGARTWRSLPMGHLIASRLRSEGRYTYLADRTVPR